MLKISRSSWTVFRILENRSIISGDNRNKIRFKTVRSFRKTERGGEEYVKDKINQLERTAWPNNNIPLQHGSPTRGPPACIVWCTTTCVYSVYTIKVHNNSDSLVYHLLLLFHMWPTTWPEISGVDQCHKKFGDPCSIQTWINLRSHEPSTYLLEDENSNL